MKLNSHTMSAFPRRFFRLFSLSFCCLLLGLCLGGCAEIKPLPEAPLPAAPATPAAPPAPATPYWLGDKTAAPSGDVISLLYYFQYAKALSSRELADELESLRQSESTEKLDFHTLQYAIALSLPNASVANQRRALQLLEPLAAPTEGRDGELQALAALLRAEIVERRRLEDIAYTQTLKYREEQRRADELDKKLDVLTKKLEALINIEKNLMHREKNPRVIK